MPAYVMQTFAPPAGSRYIGVSENGIGANYTSFLSTLGVGNVALYNRYTAANGDIQWILNEFEARQVGGMVSWNLPGTGTQLSVADGVEDPLIARVAAEAKSYGKPLMIRLNWEFNGDWFPWSAGTSTGAPVPGNSPADYVAAWRHVVSMFANDPNVTFVWSPNIFQTIPNTTYRISDWYPGNAYVGWIAMDAYPSASNWSWMQNAPDGMDDINAFAVAHGKPLMIAEWALSNPGTGDNPTIMEQMLNWITAHAQVRAELYFDYLNADGIDYRLSSFPNSAKVFRSWLGNSGNIIRASNLIS